MIEAIIVPKSITPSIVGWIYVYEFHFACESLSERVESNEIVSLDEEILSQVPIFIEELDFIRIADGMDSIGIDFLEFCQNLGISENIDIRSVKRLMEELLLSSWFFIGHPSFENTILVWEWEYHIARLSNESLLVRIVESDLVTMTRDSSLFERIIHIKKHLREVNAKIVFFYVWRS